MKAFNGIIEEASLSTTGGFLKLTLQVKLSNGFSCVFGGHCLFNKEYRDDNALGNYAGRYIFDVLDIVGARYLEDMKGKPVRVIFEKNGHNGDICIGIQNFLDYTKYFIPDETKHVKEELEKLIDPWEE